MPEAAGCHAPRIKSAYTLQASQEPFPGESRGPDGTALPRMDPGFRRGTVTCRKGIIADQVRGPRNDEVQKLAPSTFWIVSESRSAAGTQRRLTAAIFAPSGPVPTEKP